MAVSSAFFACLYLVVLVSCAAAASATTASCPAEGGWTNWGNGITNTHQAVGETRIRPSTVHQLVTKWTLPVTSDVTAIPTVSADGLRVFFPDWNGTIWCVSADSGSVVWRVRLDNLTGIYGVMDAFSGYYTGSVSRNSPALWKDLVFLGDLASGWYLALNSTNGALVWKTLLDPHPQATITMSATVHRDRVLIGVSSIENQASANPNFTCCTFRGSMLSLDARTGAILWKTYTTPVNYTGVAVWGSSPSVDDDLGMVFIGTGNNYKETPDTLACRSQNIPASQCILNPNNHVDSLVALRLSDGEIQWGRSFAPGPYNDDAYNLGCTPYYQGYGYLPNANCPDIVGQDADFGQAPMLVSYTVTNDRGRKQVRKLVVSAQKNGMVVALNPANGELVWARKAGPGGLNGGAQWGSAFDGERIIVSISNSNYTGINLTRTANAGPATTFGGLWTALDPEDGSIVWQTAVPQGQTSSSSLASASGAMAYSPVTVANGVVFVGASTITTGAPNFFALQADSGRILWTSPAAGSAVGGPSVVDGSLYWGSGYRLGKPSKTFYAFYLPNC